CTTMTTAGSWRNDDRGPQGHGEGDRRPDAQPFPAASPVPRRRPRRHDPDLQGERRSVGRHRHGVLLAADVRRGAARSHAMKVKMAAKDKLWADLVKERDGYTCQRCHTI